MKWVKLMVRETAINKVNDYTNGYLNKLLSS